LPLKGNDPVVRRFGHFRSFARAWFNNRDRCCSVWR
jgi:hypothetical protein